MSRLNGRRAEAEAQGLRVNVAILGAGRIAHSMANTGGDGGGPAVCRSGSAVCGRRA